jgi:hypothetical protein
VTTSFGALAYAQFGQGDTAIVHPPPTYAPEWVCKIVDGPGPLAFAAIAAGAGIGSLLTKKKHRVKGAIVGGVSVAAASAFISLKYCPWFTSRTP